jgi:PncC family amidohydrolase
LLDNFPENEFLLLVESCTGGLVSSSLTMLSGASRILWGSLVVYSAMAKKMFTGIDEHLISSYGEVSAETIEGLLRGAFDLYPPRYIGAVSGIAGPGGGTKEKPKGLVYIGVASPAVAGVSIKIEKHLFSGDRQTIQQLSALALVDMLLATIAS